MRAGERSPAALLACSPTGGARLLPVLAAAAAARRLPLYLVGGAVRDLLLGRVPLDLDLVVEGDAVDLARSITAHNAFKTHPHSRFGTVRIDDGQGAWLDLAMARAEIYSKPASLPTVRPACLVTDLQRRDFTINAMAMPLEGVTPGSLIDPLDGMADLQRRWVRVLHARSFQDDPCRAFRAVRYAARLEFQLEPRTARRLDDALQAHGVNFLSSARLGREMLEIARESSAPQALHLAQQHGLLRAIHPQVKIPDHTLQVLLRLSRAIPKRKEPCPPGQVVGLLALLAAGADLPARKEILQRLQIPRQLGRPLRRLLLELDRLRPGQSPFPPGRSAPRTNGPDVSIAAMRLAELATDSPDQRRLWHQHRMRHRADT